MSEGEVRMVNGKASYGSGGTRHNLCIAGRSDDGEGKSVDFRYDHD